MEAETALYKEGRPVSANKRKRVSSKKKHAKKSTNKSKSKSTNKKHKAIHKSTKKTRKSATKRRTTKAKTKVRAEPTKVSSSKRRKPSIPKRRKISKKRRVKDKSKKKHIQIKEEKPTNIHVLEPGDIIKSGLDKDLIFNSSHMNTMAKSIEGNIVEVFQKAFKGHLSKSPFEEDDIVIHGYGISLRVKEKLIYKYDTKEFHDLLTEILKPFEGEYTLNISAKGVKIFFRSYLGTNEEVERLLKERSEVLEEILAAVRSEANYDDVYWFVNWFTEDAMYEG